MAIAATGHQEIFRHTSKRELVEFGRQHAPAIVNPPANRCDACHQEVVAVLFLTPVKPHVCQSCFDAYEEWRGVLDLVHSVSAAKPLGYDPNCGMQSNQEWAYLSMIDIWQDWMDEDVRSQHNAYINPDGSALLVGRMSVVKEFGPITFERLAYMYLYPGTAVEKKVDVKQTPSKASPEPQRAPQTAREHMEAWTASRKAGEAKRDDVTPAAYRKPIVVPQQLQSNEDILEAVAMSKAFPTPERLTELYEAVLYGVEHFDNVEARTIFDGYFLRGSPNGAFIHLANKEHPNHVTVGMADIVTHKMQFCSSRGELKDYANRVAAGLPQMKHPALASLNETDGAA